MSAFWGYKAGMDAVGDHHMWNMWFVLVELDLIDFGF
jgi:hypothetical protein